MHTFSIVLVSSFLTIAVVLSSALPDATADSLRAEAIAACPASDLGKTKCIAGGTYFVTCSGANSTPQQVSSGTQCVDGIIHFAVKAASPMAGMPSAAGSAASESMLAASATTQVPGAGDSDLTRTAPGLSSATDQKSSTVLSISSSQSATGTTSSSAQSSVAYSGLSSPKNSSKILAAVAAETPVSNGATFDCKANNITTRYLHCLSSTTYVLCADKAVPVFIVPIGSACDITQDRFTSLSLSPSSTSLSTVMLTSIIPAPVAAATAVPNGAYFNCKENDVDVKHLHCIDETSYVECADVAKPVFIVPVGSRCDTSVDQIVNSTFPSSTVDLSPLTSSPLAVSSRVTPTVSTNSPSSTSFTSQTRIGEVAVSLLNSLLSKFAAQMSSYQATTSSSMTMTVASSTTSSSAA